jgi:hypothetical protein
MGGIALIPAALLLLKRRKKLNQQNRHPAGLMPTEPQA